MIRIVEPDVPLSRFWRCATAVVTGVTFAGLLVPLPAGATPEEDPPSPATLSQKIQAASQQLEIVVEEYDAIGVTLAGTKARATAVNAALTPLYLRVQQAQAKVEAMAVMMYESPPVGTLVTLVTAGTPADTLSRLATLTEMAASRRADMDALSGALDAYRAQQRSLGQLEAVQSAQRAVLGQQKATILAQIAKLKALQRAATPAPAATPITYVPAYSPGPAGVAVRFAYAQIGKPYRWAADGPGSYDCSGLTLASWRAAGVSLPHNSTMQYSAVAHESRSQLRPGDLVFYYTPIHHVAIYIGDGKVIQAPEFGEPVGIAPVDLAPIHGYGRPS